MIEELYPPEKSTTNYNELVDYQVSNMKKDLPDWTNNERPPFIPKTVSSTERKSFDELYNEYSSKSIPEQINNLKQLGRQLVTRIDGIVYKLNDIIEEDNTEQNDNNEFEITVDPLTHKVIYNPELNEYKVVRRED